MHLSHLSHLLASLSLLPPLALALALSTPLTVLIAPTPQLPQPATLPPSTSASLTTISKAYSSHLSSQNTFHFRNVSAGSYLFSIACATHAFPPLRVDVAADGTVEAWRTFRGNEWENKGEEFGVGEGNVLEVKALGGKGYYMERQSCKFFSPSLGWYLDMRDRQDLVCFGLSEIAN